MSFVVVAFVIVVGVLRMYTMRRCSISSRWKSCSAASHVSGTIVYLHGNESRAELMVQYRGGFDFTAKAVKSTSVFLCWRSICHPRPMGRRKKGDLNQGLKHVQVDVNEKRNERVVCTYVRTYAAGVFSPSNHDLSLPRSICWVGKTGGWVCGLMDRAHTVATE